jgi:hypothetical protein
MGHDGGVLGALIVAVVIVIVLPVSFLVSGGAGSAVMGYLLKENAEATHEGSELIETNY